MEKELLIQEKEKLYLELKHILARQPGPEVAEQLQIYQQTLKEKTKQMKVSHGRGKARFIPLLSISLCDRKVGSSRGNYLSDTCGGEMKENASDGLLVWAPFTDCYFFVVAVLMVLSSTSQAAV